MLMLAEFLFAQQQWARLAQKAIHYRPYGPGIES